MPRSAVPVAADEVAEEDCAEASPRRYFNRDSPGSTIAICSTGARSGSGAENLAGVREGVTAGSGAAKNSSSDATGSVSNCVAAVSSVCCDSRISPELLEPDLSCPDCPPRPRRRPRRPRQRRPPPSSAEERPERSDPSRLVGLAPCRLSAEPSSAESAALPSDSPSIAGRPPCERPCPRD